MLDQLYSMRMVTLKNYLLFSVFSSIPLFLYYRCSEKRVSAVAISNDGSYVCFADKFGVVWAVNLEELDGSKSIVNKKPAPILSHYCSIITRLVSN